MSSKYVRDEINSYVVANVPATVIDLTLLSDYIQDPLDENNIDETTPWLGLDFIADPILAQTVPANDTVGKYREEGVIFLHVVEPYSDLAPGTIIDRGEVLQNLFRGKRINNNIVIESVSAVNTNNGVTLQFDSGFVAGAITISYQYDLNL